MGFIRKIMWIIGITIILINLINLGYSIITMIPWGLTWFILAGLIIGLPEMFFIIRDFKNTRMVGEILDKNQRITEVQIVKCFNNKPAYKILPIFKNYKKGILVMTSGKYIHYNNEFIKNFIDSYNQNNNISELAKKFNCSKTEIRDIIKKLKDKKILK
ncbi:MAG: hypothetical protein ACTSRP_11455 [Candidatus Helarchaeota archaeon]